MDRGALAMDSGVAPTDWPVLELTIEKQTMIRQKARSKTDPGVRLRLLCGVWIVFFILVLLLVCFAGA
jgi:hypothetical protein